MKKIYKNLIAIVFYVLIIIFFANYIRKLDFSVLKTVKMNFFFLFISFIFGLMYRFWGTVTWINILRNLGAAIENSVELYYVYAKSWLGRYIPGKLPWILGKIYFASKYNISKAKLGISSLLEGALQVISAMIVGSLLLLLSGEIGILERNVRILGILSTVILSFTLFPPVFNRLTSLMYRVLKKEKLEIENYVSGTLLIKIFSLFSFGLFLTGLSYFFAIKAMAPDFSYRYVTYIIGVFNIAGAIGMASLFAPSGLGVRDGIQLFFLSHIISPELALMAVVFTRIWSAALDLAFYLVMFIVKTITGKLSKTKAQS